MARKRLAPMLKALREKQKLTQVQLAKKAQVTQPYIARLEAGEKTNPSLDVVLRLARALGVSVTKLLG